MKKTVVLGASDNPARYAYLAVKSLLKSGITPVPVGIEPGQIDGVEILTEAPILDDVDTVTLYLNPRNQKQYYDYIISLDPKRIIFNPGTENFELMELARKNNIEVVVGCTLIMLSAQTY